MEQITLSKDEYTAWRDGINALISVRFNAVEARLDQVNTTLASEILSAFAKAAALSDAVNESIRNTDAKAQAANDSLQRLLEANMTTTTSLADTRHESAQQALLKVDSQLELSRLTAMAAVESVSDKGAALNAATSAAILASEEKATNHIESVDEKLASRINALQAMVELRSTMSDIAIGKAEQATTLRFESVNEFRQTLTDQATNFVSQATLDSRTLQTVTQVDNLEMQLRNQIEASLNSRNELATRVASLEGKLYVGGAGIVIVITALQLALNLFHH